MKKVLALIIILNFQLSILNSAHAQRDWELTEQRNAWLTMNNAAALVTFADSSISKGTVSYGYEGGRYRGLSDGKDEMTLNIDARSYYRLSKNVMGYASATYTNFSGTEMSGSMFYGRSGFGVLQNVSGGFILKPFDLMQSADDAGRKHLDLLNIVGGIGWNVWKELSVGGKVDFSAGNYSKYKDLRHANTLMKLDAMASVYYSFGKPSVGASFIYNRSTETVKYKTYGTTDHVYQVLLDYANHEGETITYGGDGFIDENTELPLFDERCGVSAQVSLNPHPSSLRSNLLACQSKNLFLEFTYLHRHGYYGQQTQYTASYEQHDGNSYGWHVRLNLPQTKSMLHWVDFRINSEGLTSYKTNYRQVKSSVNNSVTYYEYYEPTKIADRTLNFGSIAYTAYFRPLGAIYKWQLNAGTYFLLSKQTAYLYPELTTRKVSLWTPFIKGKRNFLFKNTGVLGVELGLSAQCGDMDIMMDGLGRQFAQSVAVSYEFRIKNVRPNVALHYSCAESNDAAYSSTFRHNVMASLGVMF